MDSPRDSTLHKHVLKSQRLFYAPDSNATNINQGNKDAQIIVPASNPEQGPSSSGHPLTPPRPLPNSGKKRTGPNLSRCTPASSHHNSMSAIFHKAGQVLQAPSTPSPMSAKTRKLRMPLSKSGEMRRTWIAPHAMADMCTERVKSGSPAIADNVVTELPQLNGVLYPDLSHLGSSPSPSRKDISLSRGTSEGESCSAIPKIANWLKNANCEAVEHINPRPNPTGRNSVSPSRIPIASPHSLRSPRKSPKTTRTSLHTPRRLPHPLTPHRLSINPSKRNLPTLSPHKPASPEKRNQHFDIYEDNESSDDLAELSPRVEQYRKGHRPRRDRCASYWDEDILKENVEAAGDKGREDGERQVLGELPALTKAKVFMEGVEDAKFDFRVEPGEGGYGGLGSIKCRVELS
ncbi:MAG: hypothetical protein Q9212_006978 [Teloschistes hypoglaucus]